MIGSYDDPATEKDDNIEVAKEGEGSNVCQENKSNKPDVFQGETCVSENKGQTEENFV